MNLHHIDTKLLSLCLRDHRLGDVKEKGEQKHVEDHQLLFK